MARTNLSLPLTDAYTLASCCLMASDILNNILLRCFCIEEIGRRFSHLSIEGHRLTVTMKSDNIRTKVGVFPVPSFPKSRI